MTTVPSDATSLDEWLEVKKGSARAIAVAAIEVFAERGFHASTTRHITAKVNMSPASLYVHFSSKESVLAAICLAAHRATDKLMEQALSGPATADCLASAVGALAAWHAEHSGMARVAQYQLGSLPPEPRAAVNRLRRQTQERVREYVAVLDRDAAIATGDVASLSRALVSLCVDVCRWFEPSRSLDSAGIKAIYTELAWRMLLGSHESA
jgi:AcrR family transcriptional regulator